MIRLLILYSGFANMFYSRVFEDHSNQLDCYYITGVVYNPATAVLRKICNSTSIYSKFFNIGPAAASFVLDNTKQFMYFTATSTSDYYLFRIDLSDGSISRSLHSGSNVNVCDKGFCKIVLNENESWLYFIARVSAGEDCLVCKYKIDDPSAFCFEMTGVSFFRSFMLIQGDDFFAASYNYSPQNALEFKRITMSTPGVVWTKTISIGSISNMYIPFPSVLSSDKALIYSMTTFNGYVSLVSFDCSTGNVVGTKYKSTDIYMQDGIIHLFNNKIYFVFKGTSYCYLCIIDLNSGTNYSYQLSSSIEGKDFTKDALNNKLVVVGSTGSRTSIYAFQALEQNLQFHPNITVLEGSQSVIQIMQDSEFPISAGGVSSITFLNTMTMSSYALTTTTVGITSGSTLNYKSDISYISEDVNAYNLPISAKVEVSVSLTCSISGSTSISYWFSSDKGNQVPSWGSIDETNSKLIFNTPYLTQPTNYTFTLAEESTEKAVINYRNVNLQINCLVLNCKSCESGSTNRCRTCNDGYAVFSNLKYCEVSEESKGVKNAGIAIKSIVGATIAIIGIASIFNLSSPQDIWSIVNQFQVFMFLLLTGVYFPKDITDLLNGNSIFMFSFSFIGIINLRGFYSIKQQIDFDCDDENLKYIGFNSGSTLINNLSLLILFILIVCIHLIFECILCSFKHKIEAKSCLKKIFNFLKKLFCLTIYIRLIMQSDLYLLISSFYEMKQMRTRGWNQIFSLIISLFVFVICIKFMFMAFRVTLINRQSKYNSIVSIWNELFENMKKEDKSRIAKFHSFIIIMMRSFLVVVLMSSSRISVFNKILILLVTEFIYSLYAVIIRPYNKTKENIIEMLNDFLMLILCAFLCFIHTKDDWNKTLTTTFISIIMSNGILICAINQLYMIYIFTIKIIGCKRNKRIKSKENEIHTNKMNVTELTSNFKNAMSKVSSSYNLNAQNALVNRSYTPHKINIEKNPNLGLNITPKSIRFRYDDRDRSDVDPIDEIINEEEKIDISFRARVREYPSKSNKFNRIY